MSYQQEETATAKALADANGGTLCSREAAVAQLARQGVTAGADGKMVVGPRQHDAGEYQVSDGSPISREDFAKLRLDPTLAGVLVRSAAAEVDPDQVKAHVERAGQDYKGLIGDVTAFFASNDVKINAATLSAHALTQLAAVARVRAKPRG